MSVSLNNFLLGRDVFSAGGLSKFTWWCYFWICAFEARLNRLSQSWRYGKTLRRKTRAFSSVPKYQVAIPFAVSHEKPVRLVTDRFYLKKGKDLVESSDPPAVSDMEFRYYIVWYSFRNRPVTSIQSRIVIESLGATVNFLKTRLITLYHKLRVKAEKGKKFLI